MKLFRRDIIELIAAFTLGVFCSWAYMQKTVAEPAYEMGRHQGVIAGWNAARSGERVPLKP